MNGRTIGDMLDAGYGTLSEDEKKARSARKLAETLSLASIGELAQIIRKDWGSRGKGVNFAAKPYLDAMATMFSVKDSYGLDDGKSIVLYFLSNAGSYRGDTAKAVKAELRRRVK